MRKGVGGVMSISWFIWYQCMSEGVKTGGEGGGGGSTIEYLLPMFCTQIFPLFLQHFLCFFTVRQLFSKKVNFTAIVDVPRGQLVF